MTKIHRTKHYIEYSPYKGEGHQKVDISPNQLEDHFVFYLNERYSGRVSIYPGWSVDQRY